jgi:hypothetical protein
MKIHNMIRTLGNPGSEEFVAPEGWVLYNTVYLGQTTEQEKAAGTFKVLYVLVPEKAPVSRTRKPKA